MQKENRSRILALDLIRGMFLIAIIVDHLGWGPSLFHLVSGGGRMFASPAEGFFAISGILVGYIYGPRMLRSFRGTTKKLWKRAGLLYGLSVVFTFSYTAIAVSFPHLTGLPAVWQGDTGDFLMNTLLGRYAYGWTDFLPRYAVFMFVAPFLLWLIVKGKAWLVAALSIGGYALFHKTALLLPFSAWEIIFIPSIIIGYYLPTIETKLGALPSKIKERGLATLWSVGLSTFTASSVLFVLMPMLGNDQHSLSATIASLAPYFDKETVAIGRLMLGTLWFACLYSIVRIYEQSLQRATFGILETFGTKSLYTYCIHGMVVFVLATLAPTSGSSVLDSTIIASMVLTLMYILVISPSIEKLVSLQTYRQLIIALLRYNRRYESTGVRS